MQGRDRGRGETRNNKRGKGGREGGREAGCVASSAAGREYEDDKAQATTDVDNGTVPAETDRRDEMRVDS